MRVLIVNPGAVSTKLAVYDEQTELLNKAVSHSAAQLAPFAHTCEQTQLRLDCILSQLREAQLPLASFDAVCARGGLLRHVESGVYRVNERVLSEAADPQRGEHAANLGVLLAKQLADAAGAPAFFADPVSVDELTPLARISGMDGMERESYFHALNQKSAARQAAVLLGRPYEKLRLIVAHLGGGVSVAAHENGRVVDVFNVRDDGAMSMDRGGSLPVNAVVHLCFSGKSEQEVRRLLGSEGGIFSYLGTKDLREVEARIDAGDERAALLFRALAYQLAKDIGAMAAVLHFQADAVVLTGGMAHSERLCGELSSYIGTLAQLIRLPGEFEMQALRDAALRVLHGEAAKEY